MDRYNSRGFRRILDGLPRLLVCGAACVCAPLCAEDPPIQNSLSGRVTSRDGKAVAGADIIVMKELARPDAGLEEVLSAMTRLEELTREIPVGAKSDADGKFRVAGLEPGWYTVRVVARGYSPKEYRSARARGQIGEIVMDPGVELSGLVTDRSARPIAGATVEVYAEPEGASLFDVILAKSRPPIDRARTDARGEFRLEKLGAGVHNFLVKASGYQELVEMKVRLPGEPGERKVFRLERGKVIRGLVRGPDGNPLEGATVRVTGTARSRKQTVSISFQTGDVRTDVKGSFVFDTLADGEYTLFAWHPDYQSVQRRGVRPSDRDLIVSLTRGGQLEGTVSDASTGRPIPGAEISVSDVAGFFKEAITDRNGRYRVVGLRTSGRNLSVHVKARGYVRSSQKVRALPDRGSGLDVRLSPAGSVLGRIVNEQGGALEGARVDVRRASGTASRVIASGSTDEEGRFRIQDVEPASGLYLQVARQGYLAAKSGNFELAPGGTVDLAVTVLHLGGSIEGRVRDADGRPILGCAVEARRGNAGIESALSDADGRYVLTGLESGTVDLLFKAPGFLEKGLSGIEVRKGQRTSALDAVLERGRSLAGRIVDADGRPVAGAQILARDFSDGLKEHRAKSDAQGSFRVNGIASRDWVTLEVTHADHAGFETDKVLLNGQEIEVVLSPLGRIVGRVVDASGQSVGDFSVRPRSRRRSRGGILKPRTFRGGQFEYSGIPSGTYNVDVRAPRLCPVTIPGVAVKEPEIVDLGEIVLQTSARVSGRVVNAGTDTAVAEARVRVVKGTSAFVDRGAPTAKPLQTTGEDGSFLFTGLRCGTVALEVDHRDFVKKRLEVEPDGKDLVIELIRAGEINGRVVDRQGTPLSGFRVQLVPKGGKPSRGLFSSTDIKGGFRFLGVAPGKYALKARKPRPGKRPLLAEKEVEVGSGSSEKVELEVETE